MTALAATVPEKGFGQTGDASGRGVVHPDQHYQRATAEFLCRQSCTKDGNCPVKAYTTVLPVAPRFLGTESCSDDSATLSHRELSEH
jgi:hypothetical protein